MLDGETGSSVELHQENGLAVLVALRWSRGLGILGATRDSSYSKYD